MAQLTLRAMTLGGGGTNCYLVQNTETGDTVIVDPADEAERIIAEIRKMDGKPAAILLTHGHYDHIMAVNALKEEYQIPVYIDRADEKLLGDPKLNLSGLWYIPYTCSADQLVQEGDELELAGTVFRVLHTPGHTAGSCCYYLPAEHVLFSGDTLFAMSCGRTDLPTGSMREMRASLKRLFLELPEDTAVYPGHMNSTTIAAEKRYNPFA